MIETAVVLLILATGVLLYLTYTDIKFFLLPNRANLVLAGLGILYQASRINWADAHDITVVLGQSALGALFGAGIFLLTRYVSLKWKGVEGIGWGDVKFSAASGIWLGPAGVGFMIGGAAALLLLAGGLIILITRRPLHDFYLPFGAAAAPVTAVLLWLIHYGVVVL